MAAARTFEDLLVWQKAHRLVLKVYAMTGDLPKAEQYGLTSQIRRAAVSVAANIAEGFRKKTTLYKARFLNIAQGSLEETRYYLILINDLGYVNTHAFQEQIKEVKRMLDAFYRAVSDKKRMKE